MARAIWSGSISFGLVNIPIKLYNAVSKKGVSFHQIDARTGSRVKMQRVSAADGTEVPYGEIVKGYELGPDQYVLVEPAELESLDPEATRAIEIEEFIDLADIDPVFFDSPYYVAPVKAAEKPYALLVRAMEEQEKVGIARFVMRTKQYLAAVRAKDGALVLSTMVYADELVDPAEIDELESLGSVEVSDRELTMAKQLIESLTAEFEPERYRDEYRDRVLALIERKAEGEDVLVEAPAAADTSKVVDLMAALEASVKEAREARGRHPATPEKEADEAADDAADEAEPKKKAAKKRSAAKKQAKKSA
ncbi:MAG TPA: Ku protein [Acidimicrobiales bacterium]|nr:Ku protein [Acidimicrobiales bacterium]